MPKREYECANPACGKIVMKTPGEVVGRVFCSRPCCAATIKGEPSKRRKIAGPDHPSWKGGRVVKRGQVLLLMPEHPLAQADGYVMEGRVVLSEKLGRLLENHEKVGWKNGDTTDNRPENLEIKKSKYHDGHEGEPEVEGSIRTSPRPEFGPDQEYKPTILYRALSRFQSRYLAKFWSQVDKDGRGGCWLWTGSKDDFGYGRPNMGGFSFRVHVFSYEWHHGPIPTGDWIVRHICDVPACLNPDHLVLGTKLDNARDRDSRGRSGTVGEKNRRTKLTDEKVREIRRRWTGEWGQVSALMREFDIKAPALYAIVRGKSWKHVK